MKSRGQGRYLGSDVVRECELVDASAFFLGWLIAMGTIDGRLLERRVGEAVVEHGGERATTMVVFAEEGDAQVLGVHALEGLGREVDPIAQRLRKAEALLALCAV